MTLENCLTISTTELKKKGFFNNRKTVEVINVTKNGLCISLNIESISDENGKYLILTHTSETEINKTVSYKVRIISIPSNIGDGFVKYFVCPTTGKHCRKLYYSRQIFQHRDATGLLYAQQAKRQPISYAFYLSAEQRNEPYTKYFKKTYQGENTKRYSSILLKTSHSEVIDAYKKMLDRQYRNSNNPCVEKIVKC
nr:hypothetical protein [uncultured Flavobacterium sp.]